MIFKFFREAYAYLFAERYIIYKGSGGLFHNLTALSKAIKIARRQNRKLIIDMKQHRAFPFDFSTFFTLGMEYFEDYEQVKKYDPIGIQKIQESKFQEYKKMKINSEDRIIVYVSSGGGELDKRIQVNDEIMKKLKAEEHIHEPYIAVHFRNTDRKNDIFQFIDSIKKVSTEQNINLLYIASDDYYAYEIMKKHLTDMKIVRKVIPQKDVISLHYYAEDKYKQIYESLMDIYFILQSDYFVPSYNSGYSKGIIRMINRNKYIFPGLISQTKVVESWN